MKFVAGTLLRPVARREFSVRCAFRSGGKTADEMNTLEPHRRLLSKRDEVPQEA